MSIFDIRWLSRDKSQYLKGYVRLMVLQETKLSKVYTQNS